MNFTTEEIAQQKQAGLTLAAALNEAAHDLTKNAFRIPPGHYGFEMNDVFHDLPTGFILSGVNRRDDNPFVIEAGGVTFWFEGVHGRAVGLFDCANIVIDGLTIDSYVPTVLEGTLAAIDVPGNRILIRPGDNRLHVGAIREKIIRSRECRIIPTKADGTSLPMLYQLDKNWGVANMMIDGVDQESDGQYWLTFKNDVLLKSVFTAQWLETYGPDGTLAIGDQICLLYGGMMTTLDNCRQITVRNFTCYIGKGSWWENGGYGNHLWQNCYFGPRPGTGRILGGEGNMSQGLRHGSTYDNVSINLTSDDAINIHGFWSKIRDVDGALVTCDYAPVGIMAGDVMEFRSESGELAATRIVSQTPAGEYNYNGFIKTPILLDAPPPANWESYTIRWPHSECSGWVIKNCRFLNVYQRILANAGPGIFENNIVAGMGRNLALTSNTDDYEGGILKDIVIRNNVFLCSGNHPYGNVIDIWQTLNWQGQVAAGNISIEDNVFIGCGKLLSSENAQDIIMSGNRVINPLVFGETITQFHELLSLSHSTVSREAGNVLVYHNDAGIQALYKEAQSMTAQQALDQFDSIFSNCR